MKQPQGDVELAGNADFITDLLVSFEMITEEQADEAQSMAADREKSVINCLEEMGVTTEDEVLNVLASEYGMETFDLTDYRIPDEVIKSIDGDVARRYRVIPVMRYDNSLTIAVSDPTDIETLDSLRYLLKRDIEPVVCKEEHLKKALDQYYGTTEDIVESIISDATSSEVDVTNLVGDDEESDNDVESDAPIIRLVSLILIEAYRMGASDIHLEPMEKRFRIRYRIDGVLQELENPPKYLQNNILSRLKIMARLDISEKRVPQDGRINFAMPGKSIDLRVSSIPTTHGESIVMRILDKSSIQLGIPELGFFSDDQELIEKIIAYPDGIFLVTGPTGSGKTTSLYAFLNQLNTPNRKIITAEDPVEYELSGINQVQCNAKIGMTFARALRAMLRQSPNIVMVGEIRDMETGSVAINAALTGHLVFSTLHTNDAPTAITRLLDMGVKPFLVASAVRAVMAQRLLRRNCKSCMAPYEAEDHELDLLDLSRDQVDETELKVGRGCAGCNNGYKGRLGIYEIFTLDETIIKMVYDERPSNEIKHRAIENGMRTLRDDGIRKAMAGMTTLSEVIRITKSDEEDEDIDAENAE